MNRIDAGEVSGGTWTIPAEKPVFLIGLRRASLAPRPCVSFVSVHEGQSRHRNS